MDPFAGIVRESLIVAAVLCFPVLIVATIVGAIVAVVQAATQVQEQTLTLLPKMIAVVTTIAMFGGFGMGLCASLFREAVGLAPRIVRGG
jgi:flagellar biosynthetic protein FliQ